MIPENSIEAYFRLTLTSVRQRASVDEKKNVSIQHPVRNAYRIDYARTFEIRVKGGFNPLAGKANSSNSLVHCSGGPGCTT